MWRRLILVLCLSFLVTALGGTAAFLFEQGQPGSTIRTLGDGYWWAIVSQTTTGHGGYLLANAIFSPGTLQLLNELLSQERASNYYSVPLPARFVGRTAGELARYYGTGFLCQRGGKHASARKPAARSPRSSARASLSQARTS